MPKVSVIIVNCLKALGKQSFKDFEVVVVDNGSIDNFQYKIQRFLKENHFSSFMKLVPLDKDFGFANANIQGLKRSNNSEYLAFLNNNTEPEKNWLKTQWIVNLWLEYVLLSSSFTVLTL